MSDEDDFLDDPGIVLGTRRAMKEMADGTLRVQVDIDPADRGRFLQLFSAIDCPVFLGKPAPGVTSPTEAVLPKQYGEASRMLKLSDFFRTPTVWQALGTDEQFLAWLRLQPCKSCGWKPHDTPDGHIACEAAHVRRVANGAGTAEKPPYSATSLCPRGHGRECHARQHQLGESALGGQSKMDRWRIESVQEWGWQRLKDLMQVDSMAQLAPQRLGEWAQEKGIYHLLPAGYRHVIGQS